MRNRKLPIKSNKNGFTLIELLVVIAIIGILSSIVFVSLNTAKGKARDALRVSDLNQIRTALFLYESANGNFMETGSGCGSAGNGSGWFNYVGGSYPKSMAKCLVDASIVSTEIIDPTKGTCSSPSAGYTYMKYNCGSPVQVYVYAKLETLPQSATATDGTCCPSCDSSYGMNYYLRVR